EIGGVSTSIVTFITPILTVLLVVALVILVNKTKIGMAMRAVSKDFETSQLMGIKINYVISMTFVIGCALAAIGSILYFTPRPSVMPLSGSLPGLKCFVAAVFGGIGSIPGALIGGFIIGVCETFVKGSSFSEFSDVFTFVVLILVLLIKPTGLFGEKIKEKV
ncbi:MAG: branched-chain amino acid ABC transporter permease, partial [Oscillospiraceae bacterium]|nr:branched-chain amino acid ABC transporter permease [Oscillospiraceae bacterium]